jgi:hypothetical protein
MSSDFALAENSSTFQDGQTQHFTRLAFDLNLKRAAANLTVGGELLRGDGGINHELEGLAAERA